MNSKKGAFEIIWASDASELMQAQALRYEVFRQDFGIQLSSTRNRLDIDEFDEYCEHLLIRHTESNQIVGTYRILNPQNATLLGRLYSDGEFDMRALDPLRSQLVEVGRSCVHPEFRNGAVILALWRGLGQYMKEHRYRWMLGCTSVSLADGGKLVKDLSRYFEKNSDLQSGYTAKPIRALALNDAGIDNSSVLPALPGLLNAYIRMGAKICGKPAYDQAFNSADFLTLLDCQHMSPSYSRHFMGRK